MQLRSQRIDQPIDPIRAPQCHAGTICHGSGDYVLNSISVLGQFSAGASSVRIPQGRDGCGRRQARWRRDRLSRESRVVLGRAAREPFTGRRRTWRVPRALPLQMKRSARDGSRGGSHQRFTGQLSIANIRSPPRRAGQPLPIRKAPRLRVPTDGRWWPAIRQSRCLLKTGDNRREIPFPVLYRRFLAFQCNRRAVVPPK